MKRFILLLLGVVVWAGQLFAQNRHYDFLGAGHQKEVLVTASSSNGASPKKTIDGFPIKNQQQLKEASRFLAQATMGADFATIEMTAAMGYEAWLEEQFQLPATTTLPEMDEHWELYYFEEELDESIRFSSTFRSSWMTNVMKSPDLLRQRIAYILSQIFVVNDNSEFAQEHAQSLSIYYDMLLNLSFENYEQLLTEVTYSPMMGNFLSHFNNPKEDPVANIRPDENYAREIMQLFSIGLWELNRDGSRKYDENGQFIPTYTNDDIKEFAQVFTGLSDGRPNGEWLGEGNSIGEFGGIDLMELVTYRMRMYDNFHDKSEKKLLNGLVLPANQSGKKDLEQTIQHLANHPNTAPFISKAFIQFMTTSNPSRTYVRDVADAFSPSKANNFQDFIKAILLNTEARNCNISKNYSFGKLREPLVRYTNFLKAFHMKPDLFDNYPTGLDCFQNSAGQSPLGAPSVFNFFLPDYAPQGPIGQFYYVAPEFQILNATNAIGLVNDVNNKVVVGAPFEDLCIYPEEFDAAEEEEEEFDEEEEINSIFKTDFSVELALTENPAALIDRLDILLANGLLGDITKGIIVNAMAKLESPEEKLKMAIYLILISPDYAILK